jgi:hypothetical protein
MNTVFRPLLPTTRRGRALLAAILLLALATRLILWSLPQHLPANDETEYLAVARDLLAGRGWRFYASYPWLRAPLYPLYLAGTLALAGGDAQLALLPNIALSLLQIYGLWLLGRALAQREQRAERSGLWAAAAGAGLLTLATFANLWMAETLWSCLWTATLLVLLRWREAPGWRLAALAGGLAGLTTLTRSLPLLFLPALAAWMLWRVRGRRGVGHVLALGLACGLVIAPWTLRNWRAYGEPILVETGFAYNLWAFSEPPLELEQINTILSAIPNPAERAAYASAQGRALLAADPAILLRKPWTNTVYLWRVKPIQDRFILTNYYADVPLPYFASALVFDDGWYLALLALAAWGIGRARRDGRLALALLWLGYVAGSTMFAHGEARYRHFIWPILLAYAAQALARDHAAAARWQRGLALAGGAALIALVLGFYPWEWARMNVERALLRRQADQALQAGDGDRAEKLALAALIRGESPDGWIELGRIKDGSGDRTGATKAFQAAVNTKRDYPPASLALGAHLLAGGEAEAARAAWANEYVDSAELLRLAWRDHTLPATSTLDIGGGLDFGLIDGVYAAEDVLGSQARWTSGTASIRLPGGPPRRLRLRLADPRPPSPERATSICLDAGSCLRVELGAEWRVIELALPEHAGEWEIQLRSATWRSPGDERELGVLVDWAEATE